jgi:hypothetical protein
MDFLFAKDRTAWVFKDKKATKVGAILERDFENGEAFTAFDEKDVDDVERVGGEATVVQSEGEEVNK